MSDGPSSIIWSYVRRRKVLVIICVLLGALWVASNFISDVGKGAETVGGWFRPATASANSKNSPPAPDSPLTAEKLKSAIITADGAISIPSSIPPSPEESEKNEWRGLALKNATDRHISIAIWDYEDAIWEIQGLEPSQTIRQKAKGAFYMLLQGDMIVNRATKEVTHTYEGDECYELWSPKFEREPTAEDLAQLRPNKIAEMHGTGPMPPKMMRFVRGDDIQIDVFLPNGTAAPTQKPDYKKREGVYPFQERILE